ncbi:MAG: type IV secretion system DNA-binding domain-containing protein [Candidatus Komeilibacteria bacterium]|nr:type IV secretion system DNA-binding domain-containing protein [Candidatus Komeilibacteria bacterium]
MPEEVTIFAETNFRRQQKRFGIKTDDRRRHMYLIGKTGMGKSVTLENMIIQDIRNGKGVAVVDPHGELVEKVIKFVPADRINDVVYINPADLGYPVAFNVLESVSEEHRHLVASGLLGVFQKLWAESWGPRLEYVLNNAIMALLEYPGSTLLGVMRLLIDKSFRKKVINKISDPMIKSFWVEEYSKYPDKFQSEAIAPIQNKVGRFLSSPMIRNIVGQVKSSIDLRQIMDDQKILLLNLSKGRIGEDNSALLGAMIITKIQLAAMSRVEIPEKDRKDFYLYVDEFQNFATESFGNILSEARKYRLNLIMAHQYMEQLSETTRSAVFGNVGTIICFRVGGEDAEFLAKEFTPRFEEVDLLNLNKYHVYLKLMIDGVASEPFSATTLPPVAEPEGADDNMEKIIRVSRERYAVKREVIEEKILRWSSPSEFRDEDEDGEEKPRVRLPQTTPKIDQPKPQPYSNYRTSKPAPVTDRAKISTGVLYPAVCDACGQATVLNFIPDPKKPIYCKNCLKTGRRVSNKSNSTSRPETNLEQEALKQKPLTLNEALAKSPSNFKNNSGSVTLHEN